MERLKAVKQWNLFLTRFGAAKKAFEELQLLMRENSQLLDKLPIEAQKIFSLVNYKGKFELMLSDFVRVYPMYGGIDEIKVSQRVIELMENELKPVKEEKDVA